VIEIDMATVKVPNNRGCGGKMDEASVGHIRDEY